MSRNGQDVSFMLHQKDRYMYFTISPILFMIVAITNNLAELLFLLGLCVLLHLAPRVSALCHTNVSSLGFYLVFNSLFLRSADNGSVVCGASPCRASAAVQSIPKPPDTNTGDMFLNKKIFLSVCITT